MTSHGQDMRMRMPRSTKDLVHIIEDLLNQGPADDHVDLEFGGWQSDGFKVNSVRIGRRPSIWRLVRRLATLTIASIIGAL